MRNIADTQPNDAVRNRLSISNGRLFIGSTIAKLEALEDKARKAIGNRINTLIARRGDQLTRPCRVATAGNPLEPSVAMHSSCDRRSRTALLRAAGETTRPARLLLHLADSRGYAMPEKGLTP